MFEEPHLAPRAANCQPLTPLSLLARSLHVHARRPAVAWRDRTWSYAAFGGIVARMMAFLASEGVGRGDVVSVMLPNRPETLAAHFAVPALGAVLDTLNTRLSGEDVGYILGHARSRIVLCDGETRTSIGDVSLPVFTLCDGPDGGGGFDLLSGLDEVPFRTGAVPDEWQAIALNYTSGTTGRPKGVVYTHRGAYLNAVGNVLALGFSEGTRYLWTLPMFHCNGWSHTWAVTAAGGLHVCLDRVEPGAIFDLLERHVCTHMCCAPVVLYMLLNHGSTPLETPVRVVTGGAAPTPALLSGLEALGFEVVHGYGLTESYGPATFNMPGVDAPIALEDRARLLAWQGHGHACVGYAGVRDDGGRDVPHDGETPGEIVLGGNTLMAGYFRDPAATEAAFAGGVFHTGDLAVVHPGGQIEIRDRIKDVIISGGENISSLEIETVLHTHPGVLLAAVVAEPDPKWGERPCAFVEAKEGHVLTPDDLDTFCRPRLAGFKRPRRFVLGALPRTATGKIQKYLLRAQVREEAR